MGQAEPRGDTREEELTPREMEVLKAMTRGLRNTEIAAYPARRAAALELQAAVSAAVGATELRESNARIWESYRFWGQAREPEHFPGELYDGMLWHVSTGPADPEGRGFNARYPRTTVLSWVTEVNDETAQGAHLERVAFAHLTANRAMLELLAAAAPTHTRVRVSEFDGQRTWLVGRKRPLELRHDAC